MNNEENSKKQEEKEINPLDERKEVMQEVIDRHCKYGSAYSEALKRFHERFPTSVKIEKSIFNNAELPEGVKTESSTIVGGADIRTYGKLKA